MYSKAISVAIIRKTKPQRDQRNLPDVERRDATETTTTVTILDSEKVAVYYANRAACYLKYSSPDLDMAIDDCSEALKLKPGYVKALMRRSLGVSHLNVQMIVNVTL